jgi:hypothetical protein
MRHEALPFARVVVSRGTRVSVMPGAVVEEQCCGVA